MATTRIISIHKNKGKGIVQAFSFIGTDEVKHVTSTKPIEDKSIDFKGFADYRLCALLQN